jgi:hypothetical protein
MGARRLSLGAGTADLNRSGCSQIVFSKLRPALVHVFSHRVRLNGKDRSRCSSPEAKRALCWINGNRRQVSQ